MNGLEISGGEVLFPDGRRRSDLDVSATGDVTTAIAGSGSESVLDATGLLVAPGFVDLQCNGGFGIDLIREPERLWELGSKLIASGVTTFLPTIPSGSREVIRRASETLAQRPDGYRGAEPLGLHLEGPLLNPDRRGAHAIEALRAPTVDLYESWSRENGVRMVTLAPELPGAVDAIRTLSARGLLVAAGHTDADTEAMAAAVDAGITAVTHLFNAMVPFAHRHPGPIGVALSDRRVTSTVIVDGQHVHRTAVATAWAAIGPDRFALVTDAVAAMGTAPGPSTLGSVDVVVTEEAVRTVDGILAGSLLTMDAAVRNLVDATGCTPEQAIACASSVPARLVGADDRGAIAAGRRGDLVLLDSSYRVVGVVVGGEVVMDREGRWRS